MRRDVQLFLGKQVVNPPSTGSNLVSNTSISDETDYSFVNHAAVIDGKARLNTLNGSETNFSQTVSGLEPNKKYQLRISNLSYDEETLVVNRAMSSQDFSSSVWTRSGINVSSDAVVAPDGTISADELLSSSATAYVSQSFSTVANESLVFSVYVKKNTGSDITLNIFKDNVSFNIDTLAISGSTKFTNVGSIYAGNGWYRIHGTYEDTVSNALNAVKIILPNSSTSMYVWGAQVERADSIGLYLYNPYTTRGIYSYVNQTAQTTGNLIKYSSDYSNSLWIKSGAVTVNNDNEEGLFGLFTTQRISIANSTGAGHIRQVVSKSAVAEDYIFTTYVKKISSDYIAFAIQDGGGVSNAVFQLSTQTLSSSSTGGNFVNWTDVELVGTDRYKISIGITTNAYSSLTLYFTPKQTNSYFFVSETSSPDAEAYLEVAQLESSSGLSSGQVAITTASTFSIARLDNTIDIYDNSDGDGGLVYSRALEAGQTSFTHDFITNNSTGELRIEIGQINTTAQIEVDSLALVERIDAYYETEKFAVDMFDFEDLNVVDKIKDVRDIAKVFTEYSQKFTVPASANNNELFDHFYNEDVVSGFDHRIKHDAIITIGGADYKHGQLTLLSSTMKGGKPYSYSVVFYGNTVKLNDLLGDDQLSDLTGTILDKLNIEYSSSNILDLMTHGMFFDENNDLVVGTDNSEYAATPDIFVPFISCDSHYFYDSVDGQQVKDRVSSRNVKFPSGQTTRGIYYKDLKLAVKVKYIIQAIQEKYGVTFSDDFFSEDVPEFNELSMFLHREKGAISSQLEVSKDVFTLSDLVRKFTLGTLGSTDYRGVARRGANSAGWNNDYLDFIEQKTSTSPYGPRGFYSHRISFDVEVVGSGEYTIGLTDTSPDPDGQGFSWTGTGNKSISYVFRGGTNNGVVTGQNISFLGTSFEYVKPRFEISTQAGISQYKITNFELRPVHTRSGRYGKLAEEWDSIGGHIKLEYNNQDLNSLNSGIELAGQLPNMKVMDFLTSMFKTFNLTAYSVPSTDLSRYAGQIRVRTLDSYYLSGKKVDISSFLDTSKKIVNRNKLFSEVKFEFDKLSTLAAINAFERTGDTFGNEVMNNLNSSLDSPLAFDGGKYSVKNKFEKIMYERMTDQSDETTILPVQWGWMASKDENPIVGKALLFYPIYQDVSGYTDETGAAIALDYDTSIYDKNKDVVTQSHASFSNYIRPSNCLIDNGNSLNFGSEYDEWYVWDGDGSNENSLFNRYYKNYLLSIYDKQSRLINIETHLPVETVMKLKLEDVVIINDKRFRINSLDLNITTGKSKMELMNDLVYSSLTPIPVRLEYKIFFAERHFIKVEDKSHNEDTSYDVYLNGVLYSSFSNDTGNTSISDDDLVTGLNEVVVRKKVKFDSNVSLESDDSNIIEINK